MRFAKLRNEIGPRLSRNHRQGAKSFLGQWIFLKIICISYSIPSLAEARVSKLPQEGSFECGSFPLL